MSSDAANPLPTRAGAAWPLALRALPPAWGLAALLAGAYLLVGPPSADLAAQQYRVWLFHTAGATLWDNGWYAGHPLPGYSVLFPPLGDALGVRLAGALAAVAASGLFAQLAARHWPAGRRARSASLWFAIAITASVVSGRLTFTLGVALALAALVALQARRPLSAGVLAALTALASPVAALFLALAAVASGLAGGERRVASAIVAVSAAAPAIALAVLFPDGGSEPFVASSFWPALIAIALVAGLLPARELTLRIGAVLYALLCVVAFAVANPLGGNATRLGALVAGPLLLGAVAGRRSAPLVAALALAFAYWGLYPATRDVARAVGDPSLQAAYHEPLVRFLERRSKREGPFRVEIPFTANHWEAYHVARSLPLARGWMRQLDREHDALFYDGTLGPASYRAWLDRGAVHYVALPDVELDDASRAEARMITGGLPYLREVWHDGRWRVFAVRQPRPLATGAVRDVTLTSDGFALRALRPGRVLVRVRHTRWWTVTAGAACVAQAADGMTLLRVKRAGTVRVRARLTGRACAG